MLEVESRGGALRFRVRVRPRAQRSRVIGEREGALEVAVAAPPVDGQANLELVRTLAERLGIPKRAIEIVSGEGGRSKLIRVTGLGESDLRARLAP